MSPLPSLGLALLAFCKKEVAGSKEQRGEVADLLAERQDEGGRSGQVTSSQGELRLCGLGGRAPFPGRMGISRERAGDEAGLPAREVAGG